MIFLDESGTRWRRIKRSGVALTLVTAVPVIAIVAGSLSYSPHWGLLPLARQVAVIVLGHPPVGLTPSVTPSPSVKPPSSHATAAKSGSTNSASVLSAATVNLATPAPEAVTPTPRVASPQPTSTPSGDPTQNDFGQSHKPTH